MTVRLFAGWGFVPRDLYRSDFAVNGYQHGVPMGGDLRAAPTGKIACLLIHALQDVSGANLDRIQIVKGWVDAKGETHERVYDVAVSDGRKIGADGRCNTAVGSTVDVQKATYSNSIGSPQAIRVLKIPTSIKRARLLLRSRAGNSNATVDRIRCQVLRRENA